MDGNDLLRLARVHGRIGGRNAEDCVSFCLVRAVAACQNHSDDEGYIVRTIQNARRDFLRSIRGEEVVESGDVACVDQEDAGPSTDNLNAFVLLYGVGFSMPQVASIGGCSYATVYRRVRKSLVG